MNNCTYTKTWESNREKWLANKSPKAQKSKAKEDEIEVFNGEPFLNFPSDD